MEMVEAIIDNNYDVNKSHSSSRLDSKLRQKTAERDDKTNFETTEATLRDPAETQLSTKTNKETRTVHRKGEAER